MKRLICLSLSLFLIFAASVNTFAMITKELPIELQGEKIDLSKYTYYEDFSSVEVNQKPASFTTVSEPANSSISVVKGLTEDEKEKKILRLSDENSSSNVYFDIPVNQKADKVLFETKFKFVKTTDDFMSFAFNMFGQDNAYIARIIQWSSGGPVVAFSDQGINNDLMPAAPESDVWYTLQILIDKASGTFDVQMQSEALKNKSTVKKASRYDPINGVAMLKGAAVYNGATGMPLQKIRFSSTGKRGEMYFEYLRVSESFNEIEYKGVKPTPLELPMTVAPVMLPLENQINVNFKGQYLFFKYSPYEENGEVYVPLVNIASAYKLNLTASGENYLMEDNTVKASVNLKNCEISVNGEIISSLAINKDGRIYIPVIAFATAMGDSAVYDNEVIITKKE